MKRKWLFRRGWIACDHPGCRRMLPRHIAYRRGWWCGGVAGHFDVCRRHLGPDGRSTEAVVRDFIGRGAE